MTNCVEAEQHLLFREYLRSHLEAARAYESLKLWLAAEHGPNREAYTEGKAELVRAILDRARDERRTERP